MIAPIRRSGSVGVTDQFRLGELVRHRRYGYRGVVVECDTSCQADEHWYQSNQTQPERDQGWYHVLVHGTGSCTYAAASSLERDTSGEPVHHPLVDLFFDGFVGGRHLRNKRPWPGSA